MMATSLVWFFGLADSRKQKMRKHSVDPTKPACKHVASMSKPERVRKARKIEDENDKEEVHDGGAIISVEDKNDAMGNMELKGSKSVEVTGNREEKQMVQALNKVIVIWEIILLKL